MKAITSVIMCIIMLISFSVNANAYIKVLESTSDPNKQHTNIYSMYTSFTVTTGALWWKKQTNIQMTAKFNSAKVIMLGNLSGTISWAGSKSQSPSMSLGISQQQTVQETYSYSLTSELGYKAVLEGAEVSRNLGGNYTYAKTYEKTSGTSLEYTLDRSSAAGYYAIICAVNADLFDVTLVKDGATYSTGKMLKYQLSHPYKKLYFKNKSF